MSDRWLYLTKVKDYVLRKSHCLVASLMILSIVTGYTKPYDNEAASVLLLILFILSAGKTRRIDELYKNKEDE